MDQKWVAISLIFSFILILIAKLYSKTGESKKKPQGPLALPIIGHLQLLKQPLHRFLQELSYKYGPIYSLKFGSRPVIVISSPSIVEECFTKHDIVLANRPRLLVGKHLNYDWTTLGSASYGPLWRNLRRVTTLEFFSNTRLNSLVDIRDDEIRSLVKGLFYQGRNQFVKVQMRPRFAQFSFNVVMRMVTGKKFFGAEVQDIDEAREFHGIIRDVFDLSGAANPADFFPYLRWFDFGNMEKNMLKVREKMDGFLSGLIEECRINKMDALLTGENNNIPLIYKLLDMQEMDQENYSDEIIKGIIMIMLTAGTDTSSVTMEWALSLLLNHPEEIEKARLDMDTCIGDQKRLVEESDLPNLPHLQNIINETLRLYPAVPLLSPHEPSEDCIIAGHSVQKGTMVLTNAWTIHRDQNLWEEPLSFRPQRFEGIKSDDYRFKLIPFGLGRRSCPGANLAHKMVGLVLANLIQCFDWQKVGQQNVDLEQGNGLSMPKANPLQVMCNARSSMINVLSNI